LQIAVIVADVADAAAHIGQRRPLLATVGAPAGRDKRIAAKPRAHAALQIRASRQALRRGRLYPGDAGQQQSSQTYRPPLHSDPPILRLTQRNAAPTTAMSAGSFP